VDPGRSGGIAGRDILLLGLLFFTVLPGSFFSRRPRRDNVGQWTEKEGKSLGLIINENLSSGQMSSQTHVTKSKCLVASLNLACSFLPCASFLSFILLRLASRSNCRPSAGKGVLPEQRPSPGSSERIDWDWN
jgi:hypothetical protein